MRKKIEITTDETLPVEGPPPPAPDADAPEFGDHINPPEAPRDGSATAANNGASAYITALQAELEETRTRAAEAEKRILYLQAEFQTYRRRKEEEFVSQQKYANSELLKSLLPIVDNFERALQAAERSQSFEALIGGVNGTLKQLQAFLQKAGVTPIEAVGKEFDPNFHEAIGHTESDEHPANTVAEEVQKGYTLHDRVLRPTLVKVAQD